MRQNTPPASPYNDEDDELIYVGDNIDDVIDMLEEVPDEGAVGPDDGKKFLINISA
jgi:hypothetical protein